MYEMNSPPDKVNNNIKTVLTIAMLILYSLNLLGQTINQNYDSTLAKRLGADEYGMKMYVLLKPDYFAIHLTQGELGHYLINITKYNTNTKADNRLKI